MTVGNERRRAGDKVKPLLATIIMTDIFLAITTSALLYTVWVLAGKVDSASEEVRKNREVGCVSRYLDGQRFAPDCREYVQKYIDQYGGVRPGE